MYDYCPSRQQKKKKITYVGSTDLDYILLCRLPHGKDREKEKSDSYKMRYNRAKQTIEQTQKF